MKRDFKTWILLLLFAMPFFFFFFIAAIYVGNCGFNNDCSQAGLPAKIHTPIPTIIPASLPTASQADLAATSPKCTVNAKILLSSWINSGYPEEETFEFTDLNGAACEATFKDVEILFKESNLWYQSALACITCHNQNLAATAAKMDLSSYAGIIAGSRRTTPEAKGNDILGGGVWENSKLNEQLFVLKKMPFGRPEGAVADDGPTFSAGQPKSDQQ
jgi:hypothetical protein